MKPNALGKESLRFSYVLFATLVVAFFFFSGIVVMRKNEFWLLPVAILLLFGFCWQVFTIYYHRRNFVAWILLILYGIGATAFFIRSLRW
jgi:hypothetical protein